MIDCIIFIEYLNYRKSRTIKVITLRYLEKNWKTHSHVGYSTTVSLILTWLEINCKLTQHGAQDVHAHAGRVHAGALCSEGGGGDRGNETWEEFPASALSVSSERPLSRWQRWSLLTWAFQVAVALLSRSATGSPRVSAASEQARFARGTHDDDSGNLRSANLRRRLRCRANPRVLDAMRSEDRGSIRWRSPEFFSDLDRWGTHRICLYKCNLEYETFDT